MKTLYKIDKHLSDKLLKHMFNSYVNHRGETTGSLSDYCFNPVSENTIPELITTNESGNSVNKTSEYFKDFEKRSLLTQNGVCYYFTEEGYEQGLKVSYPIKQFLKTQWKWYLPVGLSLIAATTGILRL